MIHRPDQTLVYHITDVTTRPAILGGWWSALRCRHGAAQPGGDCQGISQRRMTEIRVDCCGNRFVGEFVPFYFCPRSPMLYTVNIGATGRPIGCANVPSCIWSAPWQLA